MAERKKPIIEKEEYKYGFHDPDRSVFKARKGLDREIVAQISEIKGEPEWMREFRLRSLEIFLQKPLPRWGGKLDEINFDDIYYYVKPAEREQRTWDEVPEEIKRTFDRLGIPEAERKFLAGVGAQYDSEVVYHNIKRELEQQGVIFLSTDEALKQHPDLFREYFGTIVPPTDNKFAALNSAVWSGGSFIYVPPNVHVDVPLQAYFRINAKDMGQFERTLIIADEGSYVHYVEGCTAPIYASESLHSAVVEIICKPGSRVRYSTIQNWSTDVYNLVTKRAVAYEDATMEWVDGNLGCLTGDTLISTYPGGLTPIRDIRPGDQVYALDFSDLTPRRYRVNAVQRTGIKDVYEVNLAGRVIRATANHPFLTFSRQGQVGGQIVRGLSAFTLQWKQLKDITPDDYVVYVNHMPDDGNPHAISLTPTYPLSLNFPAETTEDRIRSKRDLDRIRRKQPLGAPYLGFGRIHEIRHVGVEEVYDIEVDGAHNFVANGIVVHNSKLTMKYPAVYMLGKGAHGEILSIAFASKGQHQDAGGKVVHGAPYTTSRIISKSISKDGGRASYRGLLKIVDGAVGSKSNVVCDALILDDRSRSDTYPYIEIDEQDVSVGHEATVSKIAEEQLFYLMSRGLSEEEATTMIVSGFIEPLVRELPMEYAVEMNRLIQLQMEGSVG